MSINQDTAIHLVIVSRKVVALAILFGALLTFNFTQGRPVLGAQVLNQSTTLKLRMLSVQ